MLKLPRLTNNFISNEYVSIFCFGGGYYLIMFQVTLYLYLIKLIHNDYNKCLTECNNFLLTYIVNLQLKNLNYLFRNFSASRAAIQPVPTAVTACL